MKKLNLGLLAALALAVFLVGCLKDRSLEPQTVESQALELADYISYSSNVIPGQYIVVYKQQALDGRLANTPGYDERQKLMRSAADATVQKYQIAADKVEHVYGHAIKGFSVALTDEELEAVRKDDQVDYIEQDQVISVSMGGPPGGGGGGGPQTTPWGITRVSGGVDATGKRAWVIDSGIDLDHADLNVDIANAVNFAKGNSADDGNGHGTHVAGTIAAINNSTGVIGVAAGAWVVPVRVLGKNGSGSTSGVIAGVDYVGANAGSNDVANMSLGGGVSTALDAAVVSASSACPFSLAAGNESDNANNHSPARANGSNIYTVSSMDQGDNWSSFSNFGNPPVDWCAPGSGVLSTYKGGGYATLSGTSMAAPHVAGILLLGNITQSGTVNGDPDGNADKIASH